MDIVRLHLPAITLALLFAACTAEEETTALPVSSDTRDVATDNSTDSAAPDTADTGVTDTAEEDAPGPDAIEDLGPPSEVCDSGLDDDGDGDTDCEDLDCQDADVCRDRCGVVPALCTATGSGTPPIADLVVTPLSTLSCRLETGSAQSITDVRWGVTEAPAGSTARFEPADAADSSFLVDLAGRYVLHADVRFNDDCRSASLVTLVSHPDEHVHIELTWTTPGDPDETDSGVGAGTDLDLHYRAPDGCWGDPLWDCHHASPSPNWSDPERSDDDPSFGIADSDGAGPESLDHENPASGDSYQVAVSYPQDHGYGVSFATVRVYIFGELVMEARDKEMSEGQWWIVAAVSWPSTEVTPVDLAYDDVPPCGLK